MFSRNAAFASAMTLLVAGAWSSVVRAEPPLTAAEDKALLDVFRMSQPLAERFPASKHELSILLDAQNKRVALPATLSEYKAYLRRNELLVALSQKNVPELGVIMMWNLNALDITAIDHTLLAGPDAHGHEQFGPHRTSRALAIVHLAIFEAVNTVFKKYESYHRLHCKIIEELRKTHPGITRESLTPSKVFVDIAITEAAHDTLAALYPRKKDFIDYDEFVALQGSGDGTDPAGMDGPHRLGYDLGKAAAKAVLDERGYDAAATQATGVSTFTDGSSEPEPSASDPRYAGDGPDRWHPDPMHALGRAALGGNWMHVRPFVIRSADVYRPDAVPDVHSRRFIAAFKETKRLGGDSTPGMQAPRGTTPTDRTAEETLIGNFWAYDGTALLCAPPRLYNEVATSIALREKPIVRVEDMARFLVLVNVAMADAGIAAWDAKYWFRMGRPATYIRAESVDGTKEGAADPTWTPLGAPVSNGNADARNLTPPFPAFPSGHAVFGGALFQLMRAYWSTNGHDEAFSFMSDEYNGKNYGPGETTPRPAVTRKYRTFGEAEIENAWSRIYLGIHWPFDAQVGIHQGHQVGTHVFNNAFQPRRFFSE